MANFITAFHITMTNEGGYSNNPNDRGGETYAGIASNFWPKWPGWPIVRQIVAQKPANLNTALRTNAQLQTFVEDFYKKNFWDDLSLDALNHQQSANQLFDTSVNMGSGIGAKFLQQAVNALKPNTLVVDGQVGAKTIAAANACTDEALYNEICALRKARYMAIIAANPALAVFEKGWLSRITPFNSSLS
ncbi:glycoside hydrolase family 108 protein [Pedobacter sp. SYSU D00535]|uniref:glycoside hydrolase family 108 protein n=1 Tax=Pedobacter sp. SYSU D00535 TaxID=2810308 RepID=UPI001A974050|nr:glycosyl hydrolase 108 family protein [Pedobacter sp. SYSU D00535]